MEKKAYSKATPPSTFERGKWAEALVKAQFEAKGWTFVERNFRWRGGELDLVFLAPLSTGKSSAESARPTLDAPVGQVVFVEVRSASASRAGLLRYSISAPKRRRLRWAIDVYRHRRPWSRRLPVRFDVVWVEGGRVEHWPNVEL